MGPARARTACAGRTGPGGGIQRAHLSRGQFGRVAVGGRVRTGIGQGGLSRPGTDNRREIDDGQAWFAAVGPPAGAVRDGGDRVGDRLAASSALLPMNTLLRWLLRMLYGFRVHNLAVLNTPGPVLLLPNHVSWWDWLLIGACLEEV